MKVYIASPYSIGNKEKNVLRQIHCADALIGHGYTPFVPLLLHYQHIVAPRSYNEWIRYDMEWLSMCDCVLRLRGKSIGADLEVAEAKRLGLPIYYSLNELIKITKP